MKVKLISITPKSEELIEDIGRTAYLSFERQGKNNSQKFIKMLLKNEHFSVFEHASATFRVKGGSRAFTHQIVRHRLCSFTQQSQRYVNEREFKYVIPASIERNTKALKIYNNLIKITKNAYKEIQNLEIKNEDARFVLPNAVESEIVITANFREWRHIIRIRGSSHAQWEIRKIIISILLELKKKAPTVFGDFRIDGNRMIIEQY